MEEKSWHQHYDYNVPTSMRYPRIPVQDLRENSIRMANALADLGVEKGDRVGIYLANMPEYLIMYYAPCSWTPLL